MFWAIHRFVTIVTPLRIWQARLLCRPGAGPRCSVESRSYQGNNFGFLLKADHRGLRIMPPVWHVLSVMMTV